jgi:hypothetical protein
VWIHKITILLLVTASLHGCICCCFFVGKTQTPAFMSAFVLSLVAVSFQSCAMRPTNSTLLSLLCAFLMTASFPLCSMCDANSSLNNYIGTSFMAASLHIQFSTVRPTNSTLHNLTGTPLKPNIYASLLRHV